MCKRAATRQLVFTLLLLSSGCSLIFPDATPPEELVAERAQERLDLLVAGEIERSYAFTTPGYRSARTWQNYAGNWVGSSMWVSATVTKTDCGDLEPAIRCEVVVSVVFKAARMDVLETYVREIWLSLDGEWYLFQKL